jgi:hypothetical protein
MRERYTLLVHLLVSSLTVYHNARYRTYKKWITFSGSASVSDKHLFRAAKYGNVEEIKRYVITLLTQLTLMFCLESSGCDLGCR